MKSFLRAMLLATSLAFVASNSQAQVFTTTLSGLAEAPPNDSLGTGFSTVTFDLTAHTMHIAASFSGLTGMTTIAHIHGPTTLPFEGTAGVATPTPTFPGFPAGVTSGTYDHLFDMTLASSYNAPFLAANGGDPLAAETALFNAILDGKAYLNLHSTYRGGGEIRGFYVAAVPEPGAVALFVGLGVTGLLTLRRRRIR